MSRFNEEKPNLTNLLLILEETQKNLKWHYVRLYLMVHAKGNKCVSNFSSCNRRFAIITFVVWFFVFSYHLPSLARLSAAFISLWILQWWCFIYFALRSHPYSCGSLRYIITKCRQTIHTQHSFTLHCANVHFWNYFFARSCSGGYYYNAFLVITIIITIIFARNYPI